VAKSVFSDRYRALLRHVVQARKDAGITQVELAARLDKPQSFVSKSETGERRIDFVELIERAYALDIDPSALIEKILSDKAFRRTSSS
jgi:transcriptional regulator with XRE-family HTH domain